MSRWTTQPTAPGVCRVLDADGLAVGVVKHISGRWKFKAVGYDAQGIVTPGGGPLTHRHNTVLAGLDAQALADGLGPATTPSDTLPDRR